MKINRNALAALLLSLLLLPAAAGCGNPATAAQTPAPTDAAPRKPAAGRKPAATASPAAPAAEQKEQAPDDDQALFARLVSANSITERLSRHGSVQMVQTAMEGGAELGHMLIYTDANTYVSVWNDGFGLLNSAEGSFIGGGLELMTGAEDHSVLIETFMPTNEYPLRVESYQSSMTMGVNGSETLVSVTEEGGTITVVTETDDPGQVRSRMEYQRQNYPSAREYADGTKLIYTYRFDAATSDLTDTTLVLQNAGGAEEIYSTDKYTYDAEYDPAGPGSPFRSYFTEQGSSIVTVVYASGTPEEQTMIYLLPDHVRFNTRYHGSIAQRYFDPAYTQLFESDTGADEFMPGEFTIYVRGDS